MSDWQYIVHEDMIWARNVELDPYGTTREVLIDPVHKELSVRMASNERGPHVVVQVGAPIEVIAETLRKAGWIVTPPPKTDE